MRRVADTQQPGPMPFSQAIHRDRQHADFAPIGYLADAIPQEWSDRRDPLAKCIEAPLLNLAEASLPDDKCALPVLSAIDHDHDSAIIESAQSLPGVTRLARDSHPQNIHRCAKVDHFEAGFFPDRRMTPIGPDGQFGADFKGSGASLRAD